MSWPTGIRSLEVLSVSSSARALPAFLFNEYHGLLSSGQNGWAMELIKHLHLASRLGMSEVIPPFPIRLHNVMFNDTKGQLYLHLSSAVYTHRDRTGWYRGNIRDFYSEGPGSNLGRETGYSDNFRNFLQFLGVNAGLALQSGHNPFLPNPSQFISHPTIWRHSLNMKKSSLNNPQKCHHELVK
jgi:hypothetical protein